MTLERILQAAANSKPSEQQMAEWSKSTITDKTKAPTSALTGWDGITIQYDDIGYANGYAEPGYSNPKLGILFGNWNHCSRRVQDILERAGYSLEWEDEWSTCDQCQNAVRTSPDSYGWQQSYWLRGDCEIICHNCIDPEEYLESLHNKTRRCATSRNIDPSEHGYMRLQGEFKTGLHPGQDDDPKVIYKKLREAGEKRPLVFLLDASGQFEIEFSVWAKLEEDAQ